MLTDVQSTEKSTASNSHVFRGDIDLTSEGLRLSFIPPLLPASPGVSCFLPFLVYISRPFQRSDLAKICQEKEKNKQEKGLWEPVWTSATQYESPIVVVVELCVGR